MIDIEFDFKTSGDSDPDPVMDEYELTMMFAHTREQISQQIQSKLGDLRCDQHGQPPHVKITGVYSNETQQFDLQYHIDGCCIMFILKAIQALNY
jgi:hypothetical protein